MIDMRTVDPAGWQEKIHGFLKPEEDKPEHFAAIGRLITAFNGIEVVLNWLLRGILGADTKIGRAIVGGMRGGDMLAAIKRVAVATGMTDDKLKELDQLQQDIQTLRDVRDHAAHRIWAANGRVIAFSNYHHARKVESADVAFYTIDELNELARYAPYLSERAMDLFPEAVLRVEGDRLPPRDIPARLRNRDQNQGKPPRNALKPARQPRASRESK
jgi:hypothetical protein